MNRLDKIYIINLRHRRDRLSSIEKELKFMGLWNKAEVVEACHMPTNGAAGCSLSHAICVQRAVAAGHANVMVLEDDVRFLVNEAKFAAFLESVYAQREGMEQPWGLIMIGSFFQAYYQPTEDIVRPFSMNQTSGYVLHKDFFEKWLKYCTESFRRTAVFKFKVVKGIYEYNKEEAKVLPFLDQLWNEDGFKEHTEIWTSRQLLIGQTDSCSDIANTVMRGGHGLKLRGADAPLCEVGGRNVFLYWGGKEFKLIRVLRRLIELHSQSGKGYKVFLMTPDNLCDYIGRDLPPSFREMGFAHQADVARVYAIHRYGGIWLDSDTLVMESLDAFFEHLETDGQNGFFILENNHNVCNGVFGSRAGTPIMTHWKKKVAAVLEQKGAKIAWNQIGGTILDNLYHSAATKEVMYKGYHVYRGLDNVYPANYPVCVQEYMQKPYENYKRLLRPFQPFVILSNRVYKGMEGWTEGEILRGKRPINYFISKAFANSTCPDEIMAGSDGGAVNVDDVNRIDGRNNFEINHVRRKALFENIYAKRIWAMARKSNRLWWSIGQCLQGVKTLRRRRDRL